MTSQHVLRSALLDTATRRDLHLPHGSTLAAGEVLVTLSKVATSQGVLLKELLGQKVLEQVETPHMVEKHKLGAWGGAYETGSV